jgi:hypothetical protein
MHRYLHPAFSPSPEIRLGTALGINVDGKISGSGLKRSSAVVWGVTRRIGRRFKFIDLHRYDSQGSRIILSHTRPMKYAVEQD